MPLALNLPYRYRMLALLCALTTITYLDRICISLVGVRIKADFGLSNTQFGWVLAAFSLAYAIFEIPSGIAGDRFGPKYIFIRIVLFWSLFTALTGFAAGLGSLIIIRFLFGMGESGTYPNIMIVVSRWFPIKETGRALTWIGLGSQIGSGIAPLIIIPLAVAFGWRTSFMVISLLGLVWVIICAKWFRDFPSEVKSISSQERELIEKECRYNQNAHQFSWKIILQSRNLWALMAMYFCYQWGNYFYLGWMPVYLQEGRHFSEQEMKITSSLLFIVGIVGFLVGGAVADSLAKSKGIRFGRRFMGIFSLGICGLLMLVAANAPQHSHTSNLLIASNFFYCFGIMVSYAVCTDIGKNNAGTVTGAMNFSGQMGGFILAITFGKLADRMQNFTYPVYLVAAVLLIGALLWLVIDPLKPIGDNRDQ